MKAAEKIVNSISKVTGFAAGLCLLFMMLYTSYDVFKRWLTGQGLTGAVEIMPYAFCLMLYLGYGYAQTSHAHLRVSIVVEALPGKVKFIAWAITAWLGAFTLVYVTYATILQSIRQIQTGTYTSLLRVPYQPLYVLCVIGMICFLIAVIFDAVKITMAIFKKEQADEVARADFITNV